MHAGAPAPKQARHEKVLSRAGQLAILDNGLFYVSFVSMSMANRMANRVFFVLVVSGLLDLRIRGKRSSKSCNPILQLAIC
jgi:hypothetical protein